ncbi:hypothetical protein [Thermococcus thioreducens]|uniref:Uncharacterized protein n=1 Tax=Thermococcus thioreducens TaxID=277988 RepID=A0A1I0PR72_9EURY|nr:hypothetical protein [Thermococcus thioreducens]SEW16805.1 hypothetical protein SAMN05216170_2008 [Thermococcus thioreducens]
MEITVKRKAFLENLPELVEKAVSEYGTRLRKIVIEEDEKGCYTVLITYESELPVRRS